MTSLEIVQLIKEKQIQMVDFRLVDMPGRQHHVTIPAVEVDEDMLNAG
ncbi:MAG: glutamine synthetase, partial [Firmicutes bacterium]|nr:glutamine synthetase [Bacillota bacterium]